MSHLKSVLNVMVLSALVMGLTACDGDGAFKAADQSIANVTPDKEAMTEDQIKALYEVHQRQVQELKQEINLKNQALDQFESKLNTTVTELSALDQKLIELLASDNESGTKAEEMINLKNQIDALKAQIESDRTQYVEALNTVNANEVALIAELTKVRQEINKLKEKQGGITDEEILDIEKDLTEKIATLTSQLEEKRQILQTQILELEKASAELKNEVSNLEIAAQNAETEEEKAKIELQITEAKEKEVATQTALNNVAEEMKDTDANIVTLKCEKPEDCKNVDLNIDGIGNEINVEIASGVETETTQAEETKEVISPTETTEVAEAVETTEVIEEIQSEAQTPQVEDSAAQALADNRARLREDLKKVSEQYKVAEESRKLLLQEIEDLKTKRTELLKQSDEISNKIFDQAFLKESAANDAQRVEIDKNIRELNAEKTSVLDEVQNVNKLISEIQDGDLKQIEAHMKELKAQSIIIMSHRSL